MRENILILATGNPGKAREIAEILGGRGWAAPVRFMTLKEALGYMPNLIEDGETLEHNAMAKLRGARAALESSIYRGAIVIADDSGIFVDRLGGRPGVDSALYGGAGPDDKPPSSEQIKLLLTELRGANAEDQHGDYKAEPIRGASAEGQLGDYTAEPIKDVSGCETLGPASFRCVMAISFPDGSVRFTEGECRGQITPSPRGGNGFGFDPAFYLPGYGKTMAELGSEQKNLISHRGIAVRRMADAIDEYLK